ncbi:MAG: hypothetical protein ACLQVL_21165, partial [Terriglobia bacterium]
MREFANRQSAIENQPQAGIFHPFGAYSDSPQLAANYVQRSSLRLLPSALSVPRILTPEFCPADFVA